MKKIKFNISASMLKTDIKSPLLTYYTQVVKAPHDTIINLPYGSAGTRIHNVSELYVAKKIWDLDIQFHKMWLEHNLDTQKGLNGKPLSEELYLKSAKRVVELLETKYIGKVISEEEIILPFINTEDIEINWKGFIDIVNIKPNGDVILCDWKTATNVADDLDITQGIMYCLLYYKQYKVIPKKIVFEYVKIPDEETITKRFSYSFTKKELLDFEKKITIRIKEIIKFSDDINNFPVGNFDNPFNQHIKKCIAEKTRRESEIVINTVLEKNRLRFDDSLPLLLKKIIRKKYSYAVEGAEWSDKFQSGQWDGRKYMLKYNSLPIGLVNDFKTLLKDFNTRFKMNYKLVITDNRNKEVMNKTFSTVFKPSKKTPRDYQVIAKDTAIDKKIGIIAIGTSGGKSLIASEIIRQLNKRILFILNRIELLDQTKKFFEEELGVEIGVMSEGNLSVDKQITIASIQTINSILKRKDETSKQLNVFLYNINVCIYDEAQNLSDSTQYNMLIKRLINTEYIIGLSGTPFRSSNDTILMNSLVGYSIVDYNTKWLTDNGWVCPTKCYFIKCNSKPLFGSYHERYKEQIVNSDLRNGIAKLIINKFKNKKILIITSAVEHAEILHQMIPGSIKIIGSTNKKVRKQDFQIFKDSDSGVLIGTHSIFSTGINIPNIEIMINMTANKSDIVTIQSIGRIMRKYPGKELALYFDFMDNGTFHNASVERIKVLDKFGHDIEIVSDIASIK